MSASQGRSQQEGVPPPPPEAQVHTEVVASETTQTPPTAKPKEYHLVTNEASGKKVVSVILLRYLVEVILGICAKGLYKSISRNVPANLFFEILAFFPIILAFNFMNRQGISFLPIIFGGKWTWKGSVLREMSIPGAFFTMVIVLKQTLIKNTGGPGYTEMLTGISLAIGAVVQYYVNGIKTGVLGCCAAGLCAITAGIAGIICGWECFALGAIAAFCNVCRSSLMKKTNQKYKQAAGQNLLYTQAICLPVLLAMLIWNEFSYKLADADFIPTAVKADLPARLPGWIGTLELSGAFKVYFGCIPFFRPEFFMIVIVSLMSNLLVMVIYDLCSPLTYLVAAQMKGIVQVFADVFYIDYAAICAINVIIVILSGPANKLDAEKFKNVHAITYLTVVAFSIKATAAVLYVGEKTLQRRKKKKKNKHEQQKQQTAN